MAFERARGASTGQNKRSGSESPRDPRLAPVGFQSRVFPGNSPDELPSRILGRVWNAASCRVLPGNYSKIFTCVTPAPEDYEDASHHGADPCPVHEADWLRRDSGGTLEWASGEPGRSPLAHRDNSCKNEKVKWYPSGISAFWIVISESEKNKTPYYCKFNVLENVCNSKITLLVYVAFFKSYYI